MPIILNQPVVVPATQEKVFDGLFVTDLMINCDSNTGTAHISYCPFNTTTGEILKEQQKNIFINDFWKCIQQVPQAATAMSTVLSAVIPIKNWSDINK